MSDVKQFNDMLKALPSVSDPALLNVLVTDNNGNPKQCKTWECFPFVRKVTASVGSVIKIQNLTSILVSARGSNSRRCAFVWISSYGDGTISRTSMVSVFSGDSFYKWYVNGDSDRVATVYLALTGTVGTENIFVISLAGESPLVEVVSSMPSDATPLTFS